MSCGQLKECDNIKRQLMINGMSRPSWDMEVLKSLGCTDVTVDLDVYQRIYREENSPFYNPMPVFGLRVVK